MDSRTEVRCWRALAVAGLFGAALLGCGGGGDETPPLPAKPMAMHLDSAAPSAAVAPAPLAVAVAMAPINAASAAAPAPCDRTASPVHGPTALPPHGALAALDLEQQASEAAFDALEASGRAAHAGNVPAANPFELR
ncbi:MAG: hypothetical protein Q8R98_20575 [Rubrivivax sp.]|nr:hypothetical protein [Rubrivivax sp.]MDP3614243.1 hypothetical protein [Rubrivivax sp.]